MCMTHYTYIHHCIHLVIVDVDSDNHVSSKGLLMLLKFLVLSGWQWYFIPSLLFSISIFSALFTV